MVVIWNGYAWLGMEPGTAALQKNLVLNRIALIISIDAYILKVLSNFYRLGLSLQISSHPNCSRCRFGTGIPG